MSFETIELVALVISFFGLLYIGAGIVYDLLDRK